MEAKAVAKFIRVSARKTRIVAENIKGKGVEDALNILRFTPKKPAKILSKGSVLRHFQCGADARSRRRFPDR